MIKERKWVALGAFQRGIRKKRQTRKNRSKRKRSRRIQSLWLDECGVERSGLDVERN